MKILDVPQSGSLAGQTSSRNRFGQYRRSRATPVNPNTSRQTAVRSYMALNSQAWQALSDSERASWQYFADAHPIVNSLGATVLLTGHQMFNAVQTRLMSAGLTTELVPPVDPLPEPPALGAVLLNKDGNESADSVVPFTVTPVPTATNLVLFCSPPVSAGRQFNGDFRFLLRANAAAVSPVNIDDEIVAKYGVPPEGKKVFFRAMFLRSDGGWSTWSNIASAVWTPV